MSNTILDYVKSGRKNASTFNDGKKIRTEEWPVEEFLKLMPYSFNRQVKPRVKKKVEQLKKKFLLTHLEVKVGRVIGSFDNYNNGDLYVNDGNTRLLAWSLYPELRPSMNLMVTIMDIEKDEDAKDTYNSIDNLSAAETSAEKIGGYFRGIGYEPVSKKVREGKIITTVNDATKFVKYFGDIQHKQSTIFNKIDYVFNELRFLDQWNLDPIKNLSSNLLSCMIMIAKKYGTNNPRFLQMIEHIKYGTEDYNDKTQCDGVHYVMVCLQTGNPDKWFITGHKKSPELLYEMLYSFDLYMKGIYCKKKKSYEVTKNIKHRELFQTYLA